MANIGSLAIAKGEVLTSAHVLSGSRAGSGYFVLSGCDVNQSGTPGMSVVVDSGYVQYGWSTARKSVAGNTVTITAAHATLPRLDVIYIDSGGIARVYDGTATAISPIGKTDFKQMATPAPGSTIPTGIVLALVYVDAAETTILNADISDIATYGPLVVEAPTTTTSGKIPYWSSTAKTLSDGYTVGTTANCLLQLDSSARIPAVSGALLTNTANTGVMTTSGDTVANSGGTLTRIAKGTSGQMYIQGTTVPEWRDRTFALNFIYGDGTSVIPNSSVIGSTELEIPMNCTITSVRIHERTDTTGNLSCKLWRRTYSGSWDVSELDSFTITGGNKYEETGLSISLTAGDWITVEVVSVSTMKQITCSLTCRST